MENSKLIYTLIPKVMAAVGSISKNRKNTMQNYAFRGIDDYYNALQEPLSQHGIFITPKVIGKEREEKVSKNGGLLIYTVLTVEFIFWCADGSFVTATTIGEAMDSSDKSANKAMSAAFKYAVQQVFCIGTEEGNRDTEEEHHEVAPRQVTKPVVKDIEKKGSQKTARQQMVILAVMENKTWTPSKAAECLFAEFGARTVDELKELDFKNFLAVINSTTYDQWRFEGKKDASQITSSSKIDVGNSQGTGQKTGIDA